MIDFNNVFIYSDQPTTCKKCGARTEIILDLSHTFNKTEIHRCYDKACTFEFVMQFDLDFENGSLL